MIINTIKSNLIVPCNLFVFLWLLLFQMNPANRKMLHSKLRYKIDIQMVDRLLWIILTQFDETQMEFDEVELLKECFCGFWPV